MSTYTLPFSYFQPDEDKRNQEAQIIDADGNKVIKHPVAMRLANLIIKACNFQHAVKVSKLDKKRRTWSGDPRLVQKMKNEKLNPSPWALLR